MKKVNLFSRFLILVLLTSISGLAIKENQIALNADQIMKLSRGTFKLEVETPRTILLKGLWPQVCGQSARTKSYHTAASFNLQILVSEKCFSLLNEKTNKLAVLSLASLNPLVVQGLVREGENVLLVSARQELDLTIPREYFYGEDDNQTSPLKHSLAQTVEDQSVTKQLNEPSESLQGAFRYRKCNPTDFGIPDPNVCNGRYGWDLNADVKLDDSTTLRGTTQLDVTTPNDPTDRLHGKVGVRLDLLYEFKNSL